MIKSAGMFKKKNVICEEVIVISNNDNPES